MQEIKPFKTIKEQIEILESRGLIIDDEEKAEQFLSNLNYYRLSAYTLTLRKNDHFYSNVHFSEVMQIYQFDMELRTALMYLLESIEVSMRTYIGYYHSKKYGPLGYLESKTFEDEGRYEKFTKDYNSAINEYGDKEVFVKHHKEAYGGQFPIWVLVELLSFGTLSRLFKNLTIEIKQEICSEKFGLINENYIENWLQGLTILRNICAHRGRIYNRLIPFGLKLSNKDRKMLKMNGLALNTATKQLFIYLMIMNKMVYDNEVWETFIDRLETIMKKYPFVRMSYYGFPLNWKNILGIKDEK